MAEVTLELSELTPIQQEIRDSPARFRVGCIGRRSGKTHGALDEAIETLMDGKRVGWFSATYKLLAGEGGAWPTLLELIPQSLVSRVSVQDHTLRLVTGGFIEMWAMDRGGGEKSRGREYDLTIVDEAAHVDDLLGQWDRVFRAHLATTRGRALFISTPNGTNDFKTLYDRGLDPEYPEWESFHAPSRVSPYFPEDEWQDLLLAVQRGELSAATFAQEYEAVFVSAEGLVYGLDRDGVAFYDPVRNVKHAPCTWAECRWRIVAIDPGGSRDPTGMIALGITHDDRHHVYAAERLKGLVPIVDARPPRPGDVSYHAWLSAINAIAPIDMVVVGETGGGSIAETLVRLGWRASKANMDRAKGFPHTRGMLKSGRLTIAPALQQRFDEEFYVYKFKPGGEKGDPWATEVDSREHHGELMDTLRYAETASLDKYPAAVMPPQGVHRGGAQVHRGVVRRAG
jgi:hypothetical protein